MIDLLFRFFGIGGSLGSIILLHGDFLISRVRICWRWRMDGNVFVLFDNGNVRVLVLVLTLAFDSAISDDSEDPEHPEENTDTAAKNKRYGSTLPAAQMHQRMVEAIGE